MCAKERKGELDLVSLVLHKASTEQEKRCVNTSQTHVDNWVNVYDKFGVFSHHKEFLIL